MADETLAKTNADTDPATILAETSSEDATSPTSKPDGVEKLQAHSAETIESSETKSDTENIERPKDTETQDSTVQADLPASELGTKKRDEETEEPPETQSPPTSPTQTKDEEANVGDADNSGETVESTSTKALSTPGTGPENDSNNNRQEKSEPARTADTNLEWITTAQKAGTAPQSETKDQGTQEFLTSTNVPSTAGMQNVERADVGDTEASVQNQNQAAVADYETEIGPSDYDEKEDATAQKLISHIPRDPQQQAYQQQYQAATQGSQQWRQAAPQMGFNQYSPDPNQTVPAYYNVSAQFKQPHIQYLQPDYQRTSSQSSDQSQYSSTVPKVRNQGSSKGKDARQCTENRAPEPSKSKLRIGVKDKTQHHDKSQTVDVLYVDLLNEIRRKSKHLWQHTDYTPVIYVEEQSPSPIFGQWSYRASLRGLKERSTGNHKKTFCKIDKKFSSRQRALEHLLLAVKQTDPVDDRSVGREYIVDSKHGERLRKSGRDYEQVRKIRK